LADVSGRIDHMAYDPVHHLAFIAALGNNTVEVVDLVNNKRVHTIAGLHEPQGLVYIPATHELVIANGGDGACIFYDAQTYTERHRIDLQGDADNVRYDSTLGNVYVGYGNGGIAIINAASGKRVMDIRLDGHPESFQLSQKEHRIFINVPDAHEIEVADVLTGQIVGKWKNTNASANFPMALDDANNRLFVAYRSPAVLKIIDSHSGQELGSTACSGDADDVFYDHAGNRVFVSAGKGTIDIFGVDDVKLKSLDRVPTSDGARTSLWLPNTNQLLLAVPSRGGKPAALWIYSVTIMK
jgi:DNA-binding beta-propeller fold protein YncE